MKVWKKKNREVEDDGGRQGASRLRDKLPPLDVVDKYASCL